VSTAHSIPSSLRTDGRFYVQLVLIRWRASEGASFVNPGHIRTQWFYESEKNSEKESDLEEPVQEHLGLQRRLTAYQKRLAWRDAPNCPVA
jgi:hypothetical protein